MNITPVAHLEVVATVGGTEHVVPVVALVTVTKATYTPFDPSLGIERVTYVVQRPDVSHPELLDDLIAALEPASLIVRRVTA